MGRKLGAFVLVFALVAGALGGCGAEKQTCFSVALTYGGARTGTAYVRVSGDNGETAVAQRGSWASIQDAILVHRDSTSCSYRAVDPGDLPVSADAWIDVAGDDAAACADVLAPQCHPSIGDPQAHQNAVLHWGETTVIHLDLIDPP